MCEWPFLWIWVSFLLLPCVSSSSPSSYLIISTEWFVVSTPHHRITSHVNMPFYNGTSRRFHIVENISSEEALVYTHHPLVHAIVPNVPIHHADTLASEGTACWNLDTSDQSTGKDGVYSYHLDAQGEGVDVYILDTGVQASHLAFVNLSSLDSRVETGMNVLNTSLPATEDCNSHGTHVAGTAAGNPFGVARLSSILPVVVMDCTGSGTLGTLSEGVAWTMTSMVARNRPSIINLSIQADANSVLDGLVQALVSMGAIVTVAAGNFHGDACNYSPSREPLAITVGAVDTDMSLASFSDFGPCVDVYAPGTNILSALPSDIFNDLNGTKQGTSMSSPLVAGILASIWGSNPTWTNTQVIDFFMQELVVIMPTCVADEDCAGTVNASALFAQSLGSLDTLVSFDRASLFIPSSVPDFSYWSPNLVLLHSPCIQFSIPDASLNFTLFLSSNVFIDGTAAYWNTLSTCRLNTVEGVYIASSPSHTTISSFDSTVLNTSLSSRSNATTFYLEIRVDSLEFGYIQEDTYVSLIHTSLSSDPFIYFSADSLFVLNIQDAIECRVVDNSESPSRSPHPHSLSPFISPLPHSPSNSPLPHSPSNPPLPHSPSISPVTSLVPSSSPSALPALLSPTSPSPTFVDERNQTSLAVIRKYVNQFTVWPVNWVASSCFEFKLDMVRATTVYIGLIPVNIQPPRVPIEVTSTSLEDLFVVKYGRTRLTLLSHGKITATSRMDPVLAIPRKSDASRTFRLLQTNASEWTLEFFSVNKSEWISLLPSLPIPPSSAYQFSLASSMKRTFHSVRECDE